MKFDKGLMLLFYPILYVVSDFDIYRVSQEERT